MDSGAAATPSVSNRKTVSRLLFCFLPQTPLFLATVLATGVYAGAMTARVGLVYPLLRVFVQDATPEQREKLGLPEGTHVIRAVEQADRRIPGFRRINHALDGMDRYWIDFFGYDGGSAKAQARFGTLVSTVVLFLGVALVSAVSNYLQLYLRALVVVRVLISLRVRLLQNLLQQPLAFYNEQKRGELISRMGSDVQSATTCLNTITGPLLQQPLAILVPVITLVAMVWWSGLLVLLFMGAIMFSLRKQTRRINRRAKVRQRTVARVTEAMVQMFSGIRVVKAFGLEKVKVEQYTKRNQEFARDAMAAESSKAWTRTWMELFVNLLIVMALLIAIPFLRLDDGGLSWGAVIFALLMTVQIYRPSKLLVNAYTDLVDDLAGTTRVFEFMDLTPGMPDKPGAVRLSDVVGTVRFEDVSFSYGNNGGAVPVLDHVNLEVPAGQVVALVGPSGAGKSTLVNLVPRFYDPVEGRITIDGTDIREFKRESLLQQIAIVTQEPFLFNTTIRENIAFGRPGASIHEVIAAAQAAHIHDFILTLPQGYETVVGDQGARLSGGQRQRITIARALLKNAPVLLLDEATSALDSESEAEVQRALDELMRDRTVIVIAHRLSTIRHADRIAVLERGQIVELGRHDELLARGGSYARLHALQFRAPVNA
jgi:subfamily B ATP-binding cassette protein MsbA